MIARSRLACLVAATAAAVAPAATASAAPRACDPVVNPYPGTKYEGVDLTHVIAVNTGCRTARRVARGAHRKALSLPLTPSGVRTFMWRGWRVRGDVRGSRDRYLAQRGSRRVRWRF